MVRSLAVLVSILLVGCASSGRISAPVVDRNPRDTSATEPGRSETPAKKRVEGEETVAIVRPLPAAGSRFGRDPPAGTNHPVTPARPRSLAAPDLESAPRLGAASAASTNPAVVALMHDADRHRRRGNSARASASLERGLRIEPRNPRLWHELATIRCTQGRYADCESLASRSNALGADEAVATRNRLLIAGARKAGGGRPPAARAARSAGQNR